jgi:aerobic carbon-monoxide dehydrogenase small subunit
MSGALRHEIRFTLNGAEVVADVSGSEVLTDVLRGALALAGTREGCGKGECGACTVLVDGLAENACLTRAVEVEGREVTTIEGLAGPDGELAPVQKAFVEKGGIQCGFCTPGVILSAHALLRRTDTPDETEIREALAGNLCRCTGYVQILRSVQRAAEIQREDGDARGGKGGTHG